MKQLILIFILLISKNVFSQNKQIQILAGRGTNFTGDMKGYGFSVGYNKYFKKKFKWFASIGSTIHDGTFPLFYEYPTGNKVDGSIRYTTAGFQGIYSVGYNFIKSNSNEFIFKLGGLVRYQSTSYFDNAVIIYPTITNLPIPVIVIRNRTPQKTIAIGVIPELSYNYFLNDKINIGLAGSYQFDSNGDNIAQLSLGIGYNLK